ncbi:DUF4380 domain-containing protein [Marinicellulosiphila megalodicopiae]|uniref:DUF4380 domain-containing protein n=1 Tax=Marinicellulosiphila megalodicopiae TaxID=2724896 RepID=UPI003BAF0FD2
MTILTISNNNLSMGISTSGGRIVSFKIDDQESLVQQGIQVGSTFWPAPQSLWGWPPPAILDEEQYDVLEHSETCIVLQSKADDKLAVKLQKILTCKKNGIEVTYKLVNISEKPNQMAPWEITRLEGGVTFYESSCQLESQSTCDIEQLGKYQWYDYQPELLADPVPKIFANESTGWLANAHKGLLLIKQFTPVEKCNVAPGESEVEIYAHQDAANAYIEIEQQGAFEVIESGESLSWSVLWCLSRLDKQVTIKSGNQLLIDHVHNHLKL